jgi:transcriptional regulator with XRE-family HTH domain
MPKGQRAAWGLSIGGTCAPNHSVNGVTAKHFLIKGGLVADRRKSPRIEVVGRYPRGVADEHERPAWADRLRSERLARGWSQADAVAAMRTFSQRPLPNSLLDQWKRWERGRNKPDEYYRPIIAATLGTVIDSLFAEPRPVRPRTTDDVLVVRSGMDTHELVQRLRHSSVNDSTLEALDLTVEQLCCDYAASDPYQLITTS